LNGYEFQLAVPDDIPEILGIYQSLAGTPGCTWDADYPNRETAEEDIGNGWLYKLKKHDKIIAVASAGKFDDWGHLLQWKPKNPCELARIGVDPAFQKQGIGTVILQNVITAMKKQGFDGMRFIVSKTNPAALSLYEKNGFEICGETSVFDMDWYCCQMVF